MAFSTPVDFNAGDLVTEAGWQTNTIDNVNALLPAGLQVVIDGGGATISTGIKAFIEVPFKCDIAVCSIAADQSGAIKIDIWKDTYANFPPTDADTITGGNEPEIAASGVKDQDSTLTSWTKALALGEWLAFNVDSCTTIQRVTIALRVNRS